MEGSPVAAHRHPGDAAGSEFLSARSVPLEFGAIDEDGLITRINMYGCRLDKLFVPEIIEDEYRIDTRQARLLLDEGQAILRDDWERVPRDRDED